jgi:hypothetical protein
LQGLETGARLEAVYEEKKNRLEVAIPKPTRAPNHHSLGKTCSLFLYDAINVGDLP